MNEIPLFLQPETFEDREKNYINALERMGKSLVRSIVSMGVLVRAMKPERAAFLHKCRGFEHFFEGLVERVEFWVCGWEGWMYDTTEMLRDVELVG